MAKSMVKWNHLCLYPGSRSVFKYLASLILVEFNHESTAKEEGWFLNVVMLVTVSC